MWCLLACSQLTFNCLNEIPRAASCKSQQVKIVSFWCFGLSKCFHRNFAFQLFLPYVTFKPTVILPSFSQPIGYYTVCTRYGTYKEVEHVNLQNEVSYIYFKITTLDFQNHKIQHCFLFSPCLLFSIQFLYEIGIILIHRFI